MQVQDKKKPFFVINYEMLPYKMHFFLFCGAMSAMLPFKTIYTKERLQLTSTDLAVLITTQQTLVIVTKPLIALLVDYLNRLKAVIIALTVLQAVFYLSLLWIPVKQAPAGSNCCQRFFLNASESARLHPVPDNNQLLNNSRILDEDQNLFRTSYTHWIFAGCYILGGICSNALFTLSDTACYESLQKTGSEYGKQRMWGAVSWGMFAPLAGYLNDMASRGSETHDYSPGFYLMVAVCALQILNLLRLDLTKPNLSSNIFKDVKSVFSSREFIVFEAGVFMIGIMTAFEWFYLMVYLESIGASRLLLGLVLTCQCYIGEIPFMFAAGWFVKKIGHISVLALALSLFSVRFMSYSYLTDPWYVLPVETFHGFTFGVFYAAMTAYGKLSARPGTEATTQSILCITYEGFGAGLGGLIAGVGFDRLGSRQTFFVASIGSLAASALHVAASLSLRARKKTVTVKQLNISTISDFK